MSSPSIWIVRSADIGYSERLPTVALLEVIFGIKFDVLEAVLEQLRQRSWIEQVNRYRGRSRRIQVLVRVPEMPEDVVTVNDLARYVFNVLRGT